MKIPIQIVSDIVIISAFLAFKEDKNEIAFHFFCHFSTSDNYIVVLFGI